MGMDMVYKALHVYMLIWNCCVMKPSFLETTLCILHTGDNTGP